MPTLTEWLDDIEAKATRYDMPQVLMLVRLCRAFLAMADDGPFIEPDCECATCDALRTIAAIEAELGGDNG